MKRYLQGLFDATENQYSIRINEKEKNKWYREYMQKADQVWEKGKIWKNNDEWEKSVKLALRC